MSEPNVPPPPSYPPPSPPSGPGPAVSPNRNVMIVLSYLNLLCLIPLLTEKDDREVQWHAKHGLVLSILSYLITFVFWILSFIPILGCVLLIVYIFVMLGYVVLSVLCIMKGINGERLLIPGLSQYADRL